MTVFIKLRVSIGVEDLDRNLNRANFTDKSEWFHLSGKDSTTAYYPVGYGNNARVIEEPIYGLIIDNGKQYVIDEYRDLYKIGEEVFLVKEDAEKAVERRKSLGGK